MVKTLRVKTTSITGFNINNRVVPVQMAVKVGGLAPADGVDFSVFVDTL